MGRAPCCDNVGFKKGPWTAEEDQKLVAYIKEHGHGSWRSLPAKAGLLRCGKSCRLRWTNYLRPDIKRGKFSLQEEQIIIQFHALLGNRWSAIATHLPQRTDNEIKNYWNTHLKKRLAKMGIDPITHKRKCDSLTMPAGQQCNSSSSADLSHMAQWESARLEAEARLARESNLRRKGLLVPLFDGTLISPDEFASGVQLPRAPRACPSFYPSAGSHLDMTKLKALLLRTKRPSNSSRAVGHARTEDRRQAFALTDSLADSPTSTLSYSEMNIFPDKKPPPEELVCGSLIANDVHGSRHEEPCVLDEYSLPLPNLDDMIFPCSSSALSFSEERSALELSEAEATKSLDEITSSVGFSAHDHDAFVTDMLLDLSISEDDHMMLMSNAESRDYWSNILNMVNSPQPHDSSVQTFF